MFTYVIIEDEPMARLGTEHKMNLTGYPFELVGVAEDGAKGLRLINQKHPDLAIIDMQMPDTDGVQLMQELRKQNCLVEILITSGYSDFYYAKEGINAGVAGYLLKPFSDIELAAALKSTMSNLEKRRTISTDEIVQLKEDSERMLLTNCLHGFAAIDFSEMSFEQFRITSHHGTCLVAELYGMKDLPDFVQHIKSINQRRFDEIVVLPDRDKIQLTHIIAYHNGMPVGNEQQELAKLLEQIITNRTLSCGIGLTQNHIKYLNLSLEQAHHARMNRKLSKSSHIGIYDADKTLKPAQLSNTLHKRMIFSLESGDSEWFSVCMNQFLAQCVQLDETYCAVLEALRLFLNRAIEHFDKTNVNCRLPALHHLDYLLHKCNEDDKLFEDITLFFITGFQDVVDNKSTCIDTVHQVRQYLDAHYMEYVSLDAMAELFGVSPNYLSSLFASKLGINFNRYVTQRRIFHAKRLLHDTKLDVADVSHRSGFANVKYFYRVFKQQTGMTPAQYKQSENVERMNSSN